jgi:acyl transferase domain-containing protein
MQRPHGARLKRASDVCRQGARRGCTAAHDHDRDDSHDAGTVSGAPEAEGDAYAIVGYGCVLPGAANPDAFWSLLCEGRSGIADMRLHDANYAADFVDAAAPGAPKTYSPLSGHVDDSALTTPTGPTFATYDRTQRLLAVALAQAASSVRSPPERVRCLLGATADGSEALDMAWLAHDLKRAGMTDVLIADEPAQRSPSHTLSAVVTDVLGARVRTTLLDAACASSLFATALGACLLDEHQADVIVAGGVFSPGPGNSCLFSQFRGLSGKGSRPFDRQASGVIFGEGAAVIVLKRLADALRDGDRIAAVIRGAGLSSDGRSR